MRRVNNFNDVNDALREVYDILDGLRTNNLDMKKRRAVNASPSIDKYDYVVRKELEEKVAAITGGTVGLKYYTIVFSNDGVLSIGDKASAPFIVQRPGVPILVAVSAVIPPDTDDATFNVKYNEFNILNSDIHLPGGAASHEVFTSEDLTDVSFTKLGILNINVTSSGTTPSVKTTVEIFVKET